MYVCMYVYMHKALADGLVGQVLAGSVSEYNKNSNIYNYDYAHVSI